MDRSGVTVSNVCVTFPGNVRPVNGVSFHIEPGETLALVGESGSGKSMTAFSMMGLIPPPGRVTAGSIRFQGQELLALDETGYERIRGRHMAMIFQEPLSSLNPVMTIGDQLMEARRIHLPTSRGDAHRMAVERLDEVGMSAPERRMGNYPHELSGGMRQRVMIAMALMCEPDLLLADEPTTALDVTIQGQILSVLKELQKQRGMAMLFISHNLGVVDQIADRVAVMYAGSIVELGDREGVLDRPLHPYTEALLACIPGRTPLGETIRSIDGVAPPLDSLPMGCAFAERCERREAVCEAQRPPLLQKGNQGRRVACHVVMGA